jgi:predicted HTH domain antitoxin
MLPPGVFRSRQLIVGTGFVLIIFSQLVLTDAFVLNHGKNALSCCSSVLSARPTADVSKMRVNEIKDELEKLNIDFIDCFDKESLVSRLVDARSGEVEPSTPKDASVEEAKKQDDDERDPKKKSSISTSETFDKEANLEEIRGMRVRELREELGRRQISRVGLFEKEDLVKALLKAREVASNFSPTGLVMPGQVADLTGDDLEEEMKHPTPMLVDMYVVLMTIFYGLVYLNSLTQTAPLLIFNLYSDMRLGADHAK